MMANHYHRCNDSLQEAEWCHKNYLEHKQKGGCTEIQEAQHLQCRVTIFCCQSTIGQ